MSWASEVDLETIRNVELEIDSGRYMPWDYHYLLYSALKNACPNLTERGWSFLPVGGTRESNMVRWLGDEAQSITLRIPEADIPLVIDNLVDEYLRVGEHILKIGDATVTRIESCPVLESSPVVITSDDEDRGVRETEFAFHVGKRLTHMLGRKNFGCEIGERVPIHISGARHFGHRIRVISVSEAESVAMQQTGIGESRAMGLGVLHPCH